MADDTILCQRGKITVAVYRSMIQEEAGDSSVHPLEREPLDISLSFDEMQEVMLGRY